MSEYILNEYFDWLYFTIKRNNRRKFRKLLSFLHTIPFKYTVDYDENRAIDGTTLRWYFVDDGNSDEILSWKEPCTVLEMLIALAMKMESLMEKPGEETGAERWFWLMLSNLDLDWMNDSKFDKGYILERVNMFMDRRYESDGNGNIIYIPETRDDLRDVEIWYQTCWYLDSII